MNLDPHPQNLSNTRNSLQKTEFCDNKFKSLDVNDGERAINAKQFKTLAAICDHGSFVGAADALNMTQSAVSMQITALERSLGLSLFDRSRRPLRLTSMGRLVVERTAPIIAQFEQVIDELSGARSYQANYRLGVIPTVLTSLMPPALVRLRTDAPALTVNVSSGLSGRLMRLVGAGDIDGAIMHRPNQLPKEFIWRDIARQQISVVAPLGSGEETPEEVFARHPYIRFGRSAWVAPLIENRFRMLGITPETRAEIESIEAIHIMVAHGFGASVVPIAAGQEDLASSMRIVEFGTPPIYRTIGILSLANNSKKSACRMIYEAFSRASTSV